METHELKEKRKTRHENKLKYKGMIFFLNCFYLTLFRRSFTNCNELHPIFYAKKIFMQAIESSNCTFLFLLCLCFLQKQHDYEILRDRMKIRVRAMSFPAMFYVSIALFYYVLSSNRKKICEEISYKKNTKW